MMLPWRDPRDAVLDFVPCPVSIDSIEQLIRRVASVYVRVERVKSAPVRQVLCEFCRTEADRSFQPPLPAGDPLSKLRILLADDHPNLLEIVTSLLEPTFEVVGRVGDGQSLFEAAINLHPDVIVTDISMPVLNGIAAVSKLKESDCKSKIVFLTVHADPDFVLRCIVTGALGYVVKRRMATDLLPAIREAMAGRNFTSPNLQYQNQA
jgi:CheY-like chemotaxis protein